MMTQFVVWELHGVRYLCLRSDNWAWVDSIKRL